jgi:predicted phage tail protein
MVEVRLHGPLAKAFGMKWMLDIRSPAEAVHAIEANKPGIRKMIRDLSRNGLVFRVRSKDHDYGNEDVHNSIGKVKRIDIIPVVRGASAGLRFVAGLILVVVGVYTQQPYITSAGVSLMLGSVIEWLTPVPKKDEATANKQSWTLNGPTNTADQGYPVPVIYGEVLTGGYPVSAGVSASQVNVGGTLDPDVDIAGNRNAVTGGFNTSAGIKLTMKLFAVPLNLAEPYTYAWTYTTVDGAVTVVGPLNGPTLTVVAEVEPNIGEELSVVTFTFTGIVSLTVTGKEQDRSGVGGEPATLTRSRSYPTSMTILVRRFGNH